MTNFLKKHKYSLITIFLVAACLVLITMIALHKPSESTLKAIETVTKSEYVPSDLSIEKVSESDDKSVIQIISNDYYSDYNIPNLVVYLNKKVEAGEIKKFDINTYQDGSKYSDDQIVIIIEK